MAKLILKTKEYLDQLYKTDTPLNAVAKYLNLDDALVNIALNSLDTTLSLDELRDSDTSLYNKIASKPLNIDTKIDLQTMINTLESPDKELAKMFNMSQVSISRILSRNLKKLKTAYNEV